MPLRRWINSANNAIEGILYATKTQRHVRVHLFFAIIVVIASFLIGIKKTDFLFISIIATMVILAEILNSVIEEVVDLVCLERNEKARVIKDMAAGAVLVVASVSVLIGYVVLLPYINSLFSMGIVLLRRTPEELAVMALLLVVILVIITKAHFGKGHPLRGGMPSGHAAFGFSVWVATTFISKNFVVSILTFILAAVIAQSRVATKIHTPWEVLLGALLGAGITFLIFLFFT